MSEPKFMWMEGSRWIGHQMWATVIIYNTPNGIGKVEQKMPEIMGGNWCGFLFNCRVDLLAVEVHFSTVCIALSLRWTECMLNGSAECRTCRSVGLNNLLLVNFVLMYRCR